LKAQVIAIDEIVEHIPCGPTNMEVYASTDCWNGYIEDVDTSIWVSGLDDSSGVSAQDKIKREQNDTMDFHEKKSFSASTSAICMSLYIGDIDIVIDNLCEEETNYFEDNMLVHNVVPLFFSRGLHGHN